MATEYKKSDEQPLKQPTYSGWRLYTIFYPIILIVPLLFFLAMLFTVPAEETLTKTARLISLKSITNTASLAARNVTKPGLLLAAKR